MLSLRNISKSFPGVKALDNISLNFSSGEIHALLGENGAGKSTLLKIITGVYKQDEGKLFLNNKVYEPRNPLEALKENIHTVYQDLYIIPEASVAENIMIDKLPRRGKTGFINWKEINRISQKYLNMVELDISPTTTINKISIAQRQLVEIAKALASEVNVLLLDEPTSSLTEKETESLFKIMRKLKKEDVLIIFVSHILEEIFSICDKVSILRDGKHIITDNIDNLNRENIIKFMIGREENTKPFDNLTMDKNKKVLEVKNLTKRNKTYNTNFTLYKGEILGFYGLVGSGRTELAKLIIGNEKYDNGEIFINNKKVVIKSIYHALKEYKIGYVTEDRRKDGLIITDTVKINICITVWDKIISRIKLISQIKEIRRAKEQVKNLDIKITSLRQRVGTLSGGNQQKVNIAKWLTAEVDILIFDEPSIGVDIGAKEYISKLIWDLANKGMSIILISSDMPEIIRLSSRILIFSNNRIVGEVDNKSKDYESISDKIGHHISR